MSMPWHRMPAPARAIAAASTDAVEAARSADPVRYELAVERLAVLERERVSLILGAVVRSLLEDLHPAGLSGDDVQDALDRCARSAAAWFPAVDVSVLVVLLTGALGVHQPDEEPRAVSGLDVARHAPLLVADLLAGSGRRLDGYLDAAFAEIARAETMELP
jgi:hypothetical protein